MLALLRVGPHKLGALPNTLLERRGDVCRVRSKQKLDLSYLQPPKRKRSKVRSTLRINDSGSRSVLTQSAALATSLESHIESLLE